MKSPGSRIECSGWSNRRTAEGEGAFTVCGRTWVLKGHGFSRAAGHAITDRGFSRRGNVGYSRQNELVQSSSTEGLILLPELRPREARASTDKNVGIALEEV